MKKFLSLLSVVAVVAAVGTASAADRSGKFGLGVQESFTDGGLSTSLGSWSMKYGISSNMTVQLLVGLEIVNKGGNNFGTFGGRFLYDVVEKENSDFYVGLGVADLIDKDGNILRIQIPLGWEFNFSGLPEVGFSVEAGIAYDYAKTPEAGAVRTVGGQVGGAAGLGMHYYF